MERNINTRELNPLLVVVSSVVDKKKQPFYC